MWGSQWIHLRYSSCTYNSRNNMQEGAEKLQEPENQEIYYESISPRKCCINTSGTMVMPIDMLISKRENFMEVSSLDKDPATHDCREKENQPLLGMSLFIGCSMQSSALKPYPHKQQCTQQIFNIYIFFNIYLYIYLIYIQCVCACTCMRTHVHTYM